MESGTLGLLVLIGLLLGYRLLGRRLDERPSGLLTVGAAALGAALFLVIAPHRLDGEVAVPLLLLGVLGVAQLAGSYLSVSTRAFGAFALVVAAGMVVLEFTLFAGGSGRSLVGAVLVGLVGLLCLLRPEEVERVTGGDR